MKKIYIILIIMCCLFFCFLADNSIVYAESHNIDYESISNEIAKDVEKYHIPGMSIIVVDSNEVLFSETYGNCNNIDTPFIIGSMSKSFTALSIMKLVEENKIDINKSISTYIDTSIYFKNKEDGDKITVKQLLNQNSGLGTYQKLGNAKITDNYGKYEYANINYNLLGKIIESVSHKNYADYVTKNIFVPLKMYNSSATLEGSKANGLIKGYRNYFGIPVAGHPDYPTNDSWSQVSAGYISSSASDMGKYLQMYLNGGSEIIGQDSINKMFYDYIPQDKTDLNYYGMGWVYTKQFSKPVLMHSGLVENYTSHMFIIPENDIGVVVLVNTNDYLVTNNLLGNIIMPLLGEKKQEISGNLYIRMHLLIDIIYLVITIIAIYPIITINRWKKKNKTKLMLVIDIIRHIVIPVILIIIPIILAIPIWVIWYFVKDLCMVLIVNTILLILIGIYKIYFMIKEKNFSL